jgi:hypothetical protein
MLCSCVFSVLFRRGSGPCAGYWPPVLTTGRPLAATGVRPALLGTTRRADETLQVTYNHHPLAGGRQDREAHQQGAE